MATGVEKEMETFPKNPELPPNTGLESELGSLAVVPVKETVTPLLASLGDGSTVPRGNPSNVMVGDDGVIPDPP